ncbi:MAG: hypothetical protein U0800_15765 [Isosphaeraceae bacterium]
MSDVIWRFHPSGIGTFERTNAGMFHRDFFEWETILEESLNLKSYKSVYREFGPEGIREEDCGKLTCQGIPYSIGEATALGEGMRLSGNLLTIGSNYEPLQRLLFEVYGASDSIYMKIR